VGLPKRRGTIAAGSVRRELLRPVARRSRRRRHRHGSGRRNGDRCHGFRRGCRRWKRSCRGWKPFLVSQSRPSTWLFVNHPRDCGGWRRSGGLPRLGEAPIGDRTPRPRRGRRGGLCRDDLRQADVGFEWRRLRWPQEAGQRLQREQGDDGDCRHLRHPGPPNSNASHPYPRARGAETLPPQAAERTASMSRIWSSTQSPGLREKMISRRPSDH
jgi:hypothetical protein